MLSLVNVALLVVEVVGDTTAAQSRLLERIDIGIALIFLAEFLFSIAPRRTAARGLRKRWWEIFACIPISSDMARVARGLQLLRIARLPLFEMG